jgi:hypothetical protein
MPSATPTTFAVECTCGTWARGNREAQPQVLTCAGCGRPVFVFPAAASVFGSAAVPPPVAPWRSRVRYWLPPVAAAVLAVAVIGFVIAAIVRGHRPADAADADISEIKAINVLGDRLSAARVALEEGSYRLARTELDNARKLWDRHPRALGAEQARQLNRWRRQADLLADLLPESAAEILNHSVGRADKEWDAIFQERYASKSLVLDTRVYRDAAAHYHVDYHLEAAGAVGEWEFDQLKLFERLPLQQPQRLFFGFRLRAIRRLSRDRWSVVPEPDSGVLLSDQLMLTGLSVPQDEELYDVMRRQMKWDSDG